MVEKWVEKAEQKLGTKLRRHKQGQYVGACPKTCQRTGELRANDDGFIVFDDGNYWCRKCDLKGWWSDEEEPQPEKEEKVSQLELWEAVNHANPGWVDYHDNPHTIETWSSLGFTQEMIDRWGLGYCQSCPLSPSDTSLTIPVFYQGKTYDIRHRLMRVDTQFKYRSHVKGLSPLPFNMDSLKNDQIVILVEGEKKVIWVDSTGFSSVVGYPGIKHFGKLAKVLPKYLMPEQEVIIIPDPNTNGLIVPHLTPLVNRCNKVSILNLWMPPDDYIQAYGASSFTGAIRNRQPVAMH